eukprot:CAMPEP_0113583358 /NCGR_PEP_ID=MMETSP0015_2-20120614/32469_1 /TAXON_ID=2838 /ORGANISM="Odontella" /LENGTH=100 /DNA_ID=CAMNT_0000488219 /DNA_START=168 /DNA_END=467 /DNA_ORIENTATION=- /assembly_acc=CAM_ASM_000160
MSDPGTAKEDDAAAADAAAAAAMVAPVVVPPPSPTRSVLLDDAKYLFDAAAAGTATHENKADVGVDLLSATDESIDKDMLARSVAEAGRWAFGIMAADVW